MDTVCGWSFLEAAVVQAEAAAGVEVAELPEAAMAPLPGDLKTEWLSLVSLPLTWTDEEKRDRNDSKFFLCYQFDKLFCYVLNYFSFGG